MVNQHINVLFLDCGNTRIKYLFNLESGHFSDLTEVKEYLIKNDVIQIVRSNVSNFDESLNNICVEAHIPMLTVQVKDSFLGLKLAYKVPEELGVDRWLALLAVLAKYPNQNVIVVDAGTAVTIDVVTKYKKHLGGYILPGIKLQAESLVQHTAQLPLADFSVTPGYGVDTNSCIGNGITYSLVALIERCVLKFSTEDVLLVITGGDQQIIESLLSCSFEVSPNLVLDGLIVCWDKRHSMSEVVK